MKLQYQSPFPGFDPYLQRGWEGFHTDMIVALRDAMRGRLPEGLRSRIEERVFLEETTTDGATSRRRLKPDAMILEYPKNYPPPRYEPEGRSLYEEAGDGVLVAEPVTVTLIEEEVKERFIEIVDTRDGDRVVTTFELLSPSNKAPGQGLEEFRSKQAESWRAGVSLVELDFIRGGSPALSLPVSFADADPSVIYRVAIITGWRRGTGQIYPIQLRQRLPVISVPLRQDDPPLSLDLQWVHDVAYDRGEYALDIDYRKEPEPPLSGPDSVWSGRLLKNKGLR